MLQPVGDRLRQDADEQVAIAAALRIDLAEIGEIEPAQPLYMIERHAADHIAKCNEKREREKRQAMHRMGDADDRQIQEAATDPRRSPGHEVEWQQYIDGHNNEDAAGDVDVGGREQNVPHGVNGREEHGQHSHDRHVPVAEIRHKTDAEQRADHGDFDTVAHIHEWPVVPREEKQVERDGQNRNDEDQDKDGPHIADLGRTARFAIGGFLRASGKAEAIGMNRPPGGRFIR